MHHRFIHFLLLASFFPFTIPVFAQTATPPITREGIGNPYYSRDEYRLAHSMFHAIRHDLNHAQTDAGENNSADTPRFQIAHGDLQNLEQAWNHGRYDSRQMSDTIAAVETVLQDSRLRRRDREVLGRDLSHLLDFESEYY